jgi:membrane AbrB-like protein
MLRQFVPALALAFCAAQLCIWLDTPLPWMIGPLFATAGACMLGTPLRAPVQAREAGQWAIGTTLGLYFTPPVLAVLGTYCGSIALAVVFALVSGWLGGEALRRLSGVDRATAFFAMAVGSAAEMAVQAERHGARVDRVAAAHSLRIMLVVGTIPFALRAWSEHGLARGLDLFVPGVTTVDIPGLLVLIALTASFSLLLKRLRVPNAWVIGALLMAMALSAGGIHLSRVPEWMVRTGQLLIGVSLGTRFTPDFARTAPRYLASVAACAVAMLVLGAGFGMAVAALAGLHTGTMILATSPGGIAEMALTAVVLHLGVPIVTAFHVARMLVVVLTIGPLYRWITHLAPQSGSGPAN